MSSADLVLQAIPTLRRHAFLLLGDTNLADEMVGRCLAEGMESSHIKSGGSEVRHALLKVLHNHCRDRGRSCASMASVDRSTPTTAGPGSHATSVSKSSITEAVFGQLAYGDRAILLLISVERLRYEDAAEILAIPVTEVAAAVAAARNAFDALWNTMNASDRARVK